MLFQNVHVHFEKSVSMGKYLIYIAEYDRDTIYGCLFPKPIFMYTSYFRVVTVWVDPLIVRNILIQVITYLSSKYQRVNTYSYTCTSTCSNLLPNNIIQWNQDNWITLVNWSGIRCPWASGLCRFFEAVWRWRIASSLGDDGDQYVLSSTLASTCTR